MVESAIVLPMYVFLMLGILQLSLMHQAQLMTKYAAYRAVRAGAMHHADRWTMDMSAAQVVLPMFATDPMFFGSGPRLRPTRDAGQWAFRYGEVGLLLSSTGLDLPPTFVTICGPLQQHFPEGGPEVDFDDIDILRGEGASWEEYLRTKLRAQVTFNYRMPIPFANDMIARIYVGAEIARVMRMTRDEDGGFGLGGDIDRATWLDNMRSGLGSGVDDAVWGFVSALIAALQNREFVIPIRANYSMRMMSNIHLENLPESNGCVLKFDPIEGREYHGWEEP